jgi:hypothetical protein
VSNVTSTCPDFTASPRCTLISFTTPGDNAFAAAHCAGSTFPLVATVEAIVVRPTVEKWINGAESARDMAHHTTNAIGNKSSSHDFFILRASQILRSNFDRTALPTTLVEMG